MGDGPIKPPPDLRRYRPDSRPSEALGHLPARVRGLRLTVNEHPLYLFYRWRCREATDPRDKVYALLGMRRDVRLPSVPSCDYTVDVMTLFTRVTVDLIGICADLDPLIGRKGARSALAGLPSWVVDWSGSLPGQGAEDFWAHQARWRSGHCSWLGCMWTRLLSSRSGARARPGGLKRSSWAEQVDGATS